MSSDKAQRAVGQADQKQSAAGRASVGHTAESVFMDVPGPVAQASHAIGLLHDGGNSGARHLSSRNIAVLQRVVGNQAVTGLLKSSVLVAAPADGGAIVQRAVRKAGGKDAAAISAAAKSVATFVMGKPSVQPGGTRHIADIQGRGFPGFKMFKAEYAGGRPFDNDPMADGSRLPYVNGQIYQEWDTEPCVAGAARGGDRIVTSSDGKVYYTNDHYRNFTEFTP